MNWVTVIWSMVASACLTSAVIYGLAWCRNRTAWAHLLFSATAVIAGAAFTFCELWLMRVETPAELLFAMKWSHVTMLLCGLVSIIWFVTLYLGAGRRSVAWTFCGLRVLYLVVGFLIWGSVNYREITSLSACRFWATPLRRSPEYRTSGCCSAIRRWCCSSPTWRVPA